MCGKRKEKRKPGMKILPLSVKNLVRKPGRTAALVLLTAFLALAVFGGSVIVLSLRTGLQSLEARLGADIILVPSEASSKVSFQNMFLQGTTGAFYMDSAAPDFSGTAFPDGMGDGGAADHHRHLDTQALCASC